MINTKTKGIGNCVSNLQIIKVVKNYAYYN